jgi:hypothetical protein
MITSALVRACRREFGDIPKLTQVSRNGDGVVNQFNTGKYPIIEGSYLVYVSGVAKTESASFASGKFGIDLDSGDIQVYTTPANNVPVKATFKYAHWRDQNWVDAINMGIQELNYRGYFRQTVRQPVTLSAGVRTFSGPSGCVDLYTILNSIVPGTWTKLPINWSYQQDANKVILGVAPVSRTSAAYSFLRKMSTYDATSATLDVKDEWIELVQKYAGNVFYSSLAGKIAKQGHASIDDGHFSFTNLRAQSRDLFEEFDLASKRAKPTRPAKDIQSVIDLGGEES